MGVHEESPVTPVFTLHSLASHQPPTMSDIKITYFDFKGRAEISRLILAAGGKKYTDDRFVEGQWAKPETKANTPFGQVPVLTVGGKQYGQSLAIATYLAKECGLYGKSNLEQLAIDQYAQLAGDLLNGGVKAMICKDEKEKAELWKKFKEEDSPKYFAWFEKAIGDNGSGFMVGSSMTLADKVCSMEAYPKLKALCDKVAANPGIKAHLAA